VWEANTRVKHSKLCAWLVLLLLVPLAGCAPPITSPAATTTQAQAEASPWEVIHQTRIRHPTTVVGFLDETFGITGGANGVVHYTTDGGKTWPRAKNSSACRYGLEIVDEQVAWHCGNLGQVHVSTDGGRTWQAVTHYGPRYPNHCRFLSFLDAQTGGLPPPINLERLRTEA
jgi:hypothetical protein